MPRKKTEITREDLDYDNLNEALQYVLAGFAGNIAEFQVTGLSLQYRGPGDYRLVLRATNLDAASDQLHVVSFTNGETAAGVLLQCEAGFRDGTARWRVDQFAESRSTPSDRKGGPKQLTLLK